ncbi:MAG: hypothetical protein PHH47_04855 [Gallionella sp.]|nr:hypothetical protein [Gallionella sp.]MDD4947134.1 hypothetical protein [Gallionella sp.]MDD5612689.1 hypothetical protein [Gallionella sp.]
MSLAYLPEHAENALLALELAKKEAAHLSYTHRTLFAQHIDLAWVQNLTQRDDLAEKIDAFVSRFGRLQDHIGEKLIPRFVVLLGGTPQYLLDNLAYAERAGWLESTESFVSARKLRNLLVHEYMSEAELFLEALQTADEATRMLIAIVERMEQQALSVGIRKQE